MYTLLVNDNNEIITTVKERIMQRSKLVDNLHILVNPTYKGHDMTTFTVMCEYVLPVSREYKTEILVKSDELYKDKMELKLPFDTCLTKEAGKIELQLTFIKVEMDADGNTVQRVRKAGPATISIVPVTAWSNIVPDDALSAIDQRLIMAEAMINAVSDMNMQMYETKADNIIREGNCIQLTANGNPIGDSIQVGGVGIGVVSIEVDGSGNMIIHYSDGRSENIGKTTGGSCAGVYVPSYSTDGILTFTLKENAEDSVYDFDINPLNDWNPIEDEETSSDYIWEEL